MIEEDYVSFETAKLLKKKGFNEPCICYSYGEGMNNYFSKSRIIDNLNKDASYILLPTQQMAMKWLREVYKLYIEITPSSKTNEFIVDSHRIDIVTRFFDTIYVSSGYNTYEEACDVAIRYCLENLI